MTYFLPSPATEAIFPDAVNIDFDSYRHIMGDDTDDSDEPDFDAAPAEKWWCPSRFRHPKDVALWTEFAQRKRVGQSAAELYRLLRQHIAEVNDRKQLRDHYLLMPSRQDFQALIDQYQLKGH